jgi:hypothetical protein
MTQKGQITRKGRLSYQVRFNVGKYYFVSELAYHTFSKRIDIDSLNDTDGLSVVLLSLVKYGISGWRGATDTEQSMGDQDVMVEYNSYYEKAEIWMDKYLPQIKNER